MIFLFKYNGEKPSAPVSEDANADGVFFAKQVIQNACATQAILSILMNCPDAVSLGDELASDRFRDLRAFVAAERASHTVYPPPEQTLRALRSVDLERVRVCVVGQDPYDTGQH